MNLPSIIYVYNSLGSNGDELRYSLRSLKNLPHDKVVVSGDRHDWFSDDIIHIPIDRRVHSKYHDAERRWGNALKADLGITDFYAFNDDFFIVKPLELVPNYHVGKLYEAHLTRVKNHGHSSYTEAMQRTDRFLHDQGITDRYAYATHTPMRMNVTNRLLVHHMLLDRLRDGYTIMPRTVYGNMFVAPSEEIEDVKIIDLETGLNDIQSILTTGIVSTHEYSFSQGKIGRELRAMFPEPSRYERT